MLNRGKCFSDGSLEPTINNSDKDAPILCRSKALQLEVLFAPQPLNPPHVIFYCAANAQNAIK